MYFLGCKSLSSLHVGKSTASLIWMQATEQATRRQDCLAHLRNPHGSWQSILLCTQIVIKLKELT